MSISVSSSSSSSIGIIERYEDIVASSAMVQSLPTSTKNKIIIRNNNLELAFKRRMMF
jgi:hypothetical protein